MGLGSHCHWREEAPSSHDFWALSDGSADELLWCWILPSFYPAPLPLGCLPHNLLRSVSPAASTKPTFFSAISPLDHNTSTETAAIHCLQLSWGPSAGLPTKGTSMRRSANTVRIWGLLLMLLVHLRDFFVELAVLRV